MWQVFVDIGLILGTFLDPTPKVRIPRANDPMGSGLSDINTENNNVKELFGYDIPTKPSEFLTRFADLTNAVYLSGVLGYRVAFNLATKSTVEYYFGAVTDTSLNLFVNDSATSNSCTMNYIISLLDLKIYGSRALAKTVEYYNDEKAEEPLAEILEYGEKSIDFFRATFHQNCSDSKGDSTMENERIKLLMKLASSCKNQSDPSESNEDVIIKLNFDRETKKKALQAFDEAHEKIADASNTTNSQNILYDAVSHGVLYHYYTLLYVIGEEETKANRTSALLFYEGYVSNFLKLGKLIIKPSASGEAEKLHNVLAKLLNSSFQISLNLLQFFYSPTTENKKKTTASARVLGGDVYTLLDTLKPKKVCQIQKSYS